MNRVSVPFIDLGAANEALGGQLEAAVARVLASGRYLLGPELEAFESEFAELCGTRHCVGVGSGLSALELGLAAAGIGAGDEVIVPSYTWIATWTAVSRVGATPVAVDVDERTYNLDPSLVSAALTERTAAIIPVHLRGQPAEIGPILEIAAREGLFVLEDAAQAHGARYDGRRAGNLGGAAAFSFYPTKNLGAIGDGGAVTTDDDAIADRVRVLRNYGMRDRYRIESDGVNSRLAEVQAAVLRAKLPHLDADNAARAALAERYRAGLAGAEAISLPEVPDRTEPVWHLFMVGHPQRDACLEALRERGIAALVHYPVLPHAAPQYRDAGWGPDAVAVAERLCARALSLPMYPQLDPGRCDDVAEAVLQTLRPEA